jgi:NAD(P)H-flavin reductase
MTLVVSFKSRQDLICWPDLCELEAVPGVQILTTLSRDNLAPAPFLHGRISADCLAEIFVNQCHEVTVMSCGPQAIMDQACEVAASSGIPLQQIKTESFES